MDNEMDSVLVTTKHRGVFAGQLKERTINDKSPLAKVSTDDLLAELTRRGVSNDREVLVGIRNCISWDSSIRGFLGLAVDGPNDNCRIGPKAMETELWGVTSITKMTQVAIDKWESAPWK